MEGNDRQVELNKILISVNFDFLKNQLNKLYINFVKNVLGFP